MRRASVFVLFSMIVCMFCLCPVLVQSWSWSWSWSWFSPGPGSVLVLVQSWFSPGPGPGSVLVQSWSWSWFSPGLGPGPGSVLVSVSCRFVSDATVALFVAVLLFVLPSEPPSHLCFWRTAPSEPSVPTGPAPALLTWGVAQRKMPWNIVLLLGGGFALAKGSEESGLSRWLGEQMTPLQTVPPWAIAVVICLLIATFTECASNVTTATLFLPILASMSQSMALNPLYVMIPCTLSASFAFMLPVATPPNAIVFSYGYLKVSDMARTGLVMNIIGILVISLSVNSWGRVLFELDTFPEWANATAPR